MMDEGSHFKAIAEELAALRGRQLTLGLESLAEIRRTEAELAERLREVFGLEEEKAAAWLVQPQFGSGMSPVEIMAVGKFEEAGKALASIAFGLGA
jgi:hypothetical protein